MFSLQHFYSFKIQFLKIFAKLYLLTYVFCLVMSRRRSNVARLGPSYLVLVRYPGSDAAASSVSYIVCINGRVPERYKVWSLNRHGVSEVHLTGRVKLFDLFAEDTFRSTF